MLTILSVDGDRMVMPLLDGERVDHYTRDKIANEHPITYLSSDEVKCGCGWSTNPPVKEWRRETDRLDWLIDQLTSHRRSEMARHKKRILASRIAGDLATTDVMEDLNSDLPHEYGLAPKEKNR